MATDHKYHEVVVTDKSLVEIASDTKLTDEERAQICQRIDTLIDELMLLGQHPGTPTDLKESPPPMQYRGAIRTDIN